MSKTINKDALYDLISETLAQQSTYHHDYSKIAGRIIAKKLHKHTNADYLETTKTLYNYVDNLNEHCPLVAKYVLDFVTDNINVLNEIMDYTKDYNFDFFGIKTLMRSYLIKTHDGSLIERPQHMYMRVAIGIHYPDLKSIISTYVNLSNFIYSHASPTLFNAGTVHPQMSSCFLIHMKGDSLKEIYETLKNCALISKSSGGIGLSIHNLRACGSLIRGTGVESTGLVPLLKVFNNSARYINQGGGKRMGSYAMQLEPWHADIEEFLKLKRNTGKDEERARDLF